MVTNNTPSQFGAWIAFQQSIGSVDRSIQLLKAIGAQWVAPRAGAGRGRDVRWAPGEARTDIQKYHAAGLKVYPWIYCWPSAADTEVEIFKALKDEGADGVFIDAEIEWQEDGTHKQQAEDFMKKLRAALGDDYPIMHAPFAYPVYHNQFPYNEFGKYCDQVHPQSYWSEINNDTAQHHILAIQSQWDAWAQKHPEALGAAGAVCHIGVTYGKEIGGPTPGTFRPSDLKFFMDWCVEHKLPSYSVYSLDAMNQLAYDTLKAIQNGTPVPNDPIPAPVQPHVGLRLGDKGSDVIHLQELLNSLNFTGNDGKSLVVDGDFGPNLQHAIEAFQQAHGLIVN